MTIGEWLRHAREVLTESGCPDPQIDSRWIAEDTLSLSRSELRFEGERALEAEELEQLESRLKQRAEGEPVQYILHSAYFMGLKFYVDDRVLIPRQDTETLAEAVIVALHEFPEPDVLDLCAGSGAIGLSVKTLIPSANVTLTDLSRDALEVVRKNAHELNVDVETRHGDLFKAVGKDRFDLVVSNPPYIPHDDLAGLQREVRREPMLALDGGSDGLDVYRRIAAEVSAHLNPGGFLYLEVGIGEAEKVLTLVTENVECAQVGTINDLNGIPRVVWARSV
mgnify:CR=1 FL=1